MTTSAHVAASAAVMTSNPASFALAALAEFGRSATQIAPTPESLRLFA